jgi:hypothetical protein
LKTLALSMSLASAGVLVGACTVGAVVYTGKTCTGSCPDGLSCVDNVCVQGQPDATTDASQPDGAPTVCWDGGRFCDDFERSAVQGAWDSVSTASGGQIAIASDGDAGNHVLQVNVMPGSMSKTPTAFLSKHLATNVDSVTYAFDLFVTGVVWQSAVLANIQLQETDGTNAFISVIMRYATDGGPGSSMGVEEYHSQTSDGGSSGGGEYLPIPFGTWCTVAVTADFVARMLTVTVDGVIQYQNALFSPTPNYAPGDVTIQAGLSNIDVSGFKDNSAFEAEIDNVWVDYTP